MGLAYNELVAPAILLMNPGVTREEFVELLDQTHSSMHTYKDEDPHDYFEKKWQDSEYHDGLEGLASLLGLELSNAFQEFQKKGKDNGLCLYPPGLLPLGDNKPPYKYEVVVHEGNDVREPEVVTGLSWNKLSVGGLWVEPQLQSTGGIVMQIFNEERLSTGDDEDDGGPTYKYDLEIKPASMRVRSELFLSDGEVYAKWPQFHPANKFDWSLERGHFEIFLCEDQYRWVNGNGRYYLDPETFNLIPESLRSRKGVACWGYTDLILTAEAVKKNAWKLLSYGGFQYLPQFLERFPDSYAAYQRAVWDSHTSLHAKMIGMTVSEFLRKRVVGFRSDLD